MGDIVLKLNGIDVTILKHAEISEMIANFNNNFEVSVLRTLVESDGIPESSSIEENVNYNDYGKNGGVYDDDSKNDNIDEHIAEIMSGEAEILKTHNVIG